MISNHELLHLFKSKLYSFHTRLFEDMIFSYYFSLHLISVQIIIMYEIISSVQSLQKNFAVSGNVSGYVSVLHCRQHSTIIHTLCYIQNCFILMGNRFHSIIILFVVFLSWMVWHREIFCSQKRSWSLLKPVILWEMRAITITYNKLLL